MTKTVVLEVMEMMMLIRLSTNCFTTTVHSPELNRKMTMVLQAEAATVTETLTETKTMPMTVEEQILRACSTLPATMAFTMAAPKPWQKVVRSLPPLMAAAKPVPRLSASASACLATKSAMASLLSAPRMSLTTGSLTEVWPLARPETWEVALAVATASTKAWVSAGAGLDAFSAVGLTSEAAGEGLTSETAGAGLDSEEAGAGLDSEAAGEGLDSEAAGLGLASEAAGLGLALEPVEKVTGLLGPPASEV